MVDSLLLLLGAASSAMGMMNSPILRRQSETCPANLPYSCQNTTAVADTCCFNSPGGLLLQTQFWDTDPSAGPSDSWTIHGLWPDNCDGTYEASCDPSRAYTNITDILSAAGDQDLLNYMDTYWVSDDGTAESFWEHEWGKHGTCISTLDPSCYTNYQPTEEVPDFFNTVVNLFKTLPTYDWLNQAGIVPSSSQTYTAADIQSALGQNRNGYSVYLGCTNSNQLDEVWYFFNVQGSVQSGTFAPVDSTTSSTCPDTGIQYLPKSGSSSSSSKTTSAPTKSTTIAAPTSAKTTATTTTTTAAQPTSTNGFSGSGYLNVISGGSQDGCIISAGTWYTTGTCATFTATTSGSGFTLTSSKGKCAVSSSSGQLSCSSSVSTATVFTASNGYLAYSGSTAFSADSVPSGSTQASVYSGSKHSAGIQIQWQSK